MSKLFYVMGASGVGKDSLLGYVREGVRKGVRENAGENVKESAKENIQKNNGLMFAHRYITRPADAGGENHIALTHQEFLQRSRHRCFAMSWQSHGNWYGIGSEVDQWLEQGLNVVVNGSRDYFSSAAARYPNIVPVLIAADKDRLLDRLLKRGRENQEDIERRLHVSESTVGKLKHPALVVIENNGELAVAGETLMNLLTCIEPNTISSSSVNKTSKVRA